MAAIRKFFGFLESKGRNMNRLRISFVLTTVVLALFVSRVALAEEVKCDGTITKIEGEKVTVKSGNQEHHMTVLPATKIILDGKAAKSTDLNVGQQVKCSCN